MSDTILRLIFFMGILLVLILAEIFLPKKERIHSRKNRWITNGLITIINTASIAGYEGQIGQSAYSASKAGVIGMTLTAARDLARHGIRVCTIAPGIFDTPLMSLAKEENKQSLLEATQFPHRFGNTKEFADLAGHIVQNSYLNGETIRLDSAMRMGAK